jgi:hypothetical protein
MSKKLNWLLAGAALTLVSGAAVAADAKKDDKAEHRVERHVFVQRAGSPGEMRMYRRHGGSAEDRAEHLKTMLQLKPNQEGALKAYLESTKPDHDTVMKSEHKRGETTTPQRLDEMEKRMAERQAELKKRNDATRTFYAQLDASQKKVFDTMPHMAGGHGHMAMMHRMPHMGRMPHPPVPPVPPVPPAPPEARD